MVIGQGKTRAFGRLFAGLVFMGVIWFVSSVALSMFRNAISPGVELRESPLFALAYAIVMIGAYWGFVRIMERRKVSELGVANIAKPVFIGVAIPALFVFSTLAVLRLFGAFHVLHERAWVFVKGSLADGIYSGAVEEVIFRGILFRILEEIFGTWLALLISAAAFWAAHLGNPDQQALNSLAIALLPGVLLGSAYIATRTLWLPITIHAVWDLLLGNLAMGNTGLLETSYNGPRWLTGGPIAPDGSVIEALLILTITAAFLRYASRHGRIYARNHSLMTT